MDRRKSPNFETIFFVFLLFRLSEETRKSNIRFPNFLGKSEQQEDVEILFQRWRLSAVHNVKKTIQEKNIFEFVFLVFLNNIFNSC